MALGQRSLLPGSCPAPRGGKRPGPAAGWPEGEAPGWLLACLRAPGRSAWWCQLRAPSEARGSCCARPRLAWSPSPGGAICPVLAVRPGKSLVSQGHGHLRPRVLSVLWSCRVPPGAFRPSPQPGGPAGPMLPCSVPASVSFRGCWEGGGAGRRWREGG